jgi:hypothetical protein
MLTAIVWLLHRCQNGVYVGGVVQKIGVRRIDKQRGDVVLV